MAQGTVTCYSSSCMSTVPSITFYTFPPSSLPAHLPWSFVCGGGRGVWVWVWLQEASLSIEEQ